MSNGGYKGNTPARETSPEQYPGVWELTEQFQAQADGNWPFQETDCAPKSLRFDSSSSAYLSKTFAVAGNRRTWTWSAWVKRGDLGSTEQLFVGGPNDADRLNIRFESDDRLGVDEYSSGATQFYIKTARVLRDPSAWMHLTVAFNSTDIEADRLKIYCNGKRETDLTVTTAVPANYSGRISSQATHFIGKHAPSSSQFYNGLLSEVHFIDGQALSCEEFGFFDGQGIWQPKRFTGDYSSGLVYSNYGIDINVDSTPRLWIHVFDGLSSTYLTGNGTTNDQSVWTFSNGIPVKNSLRLRLGGGNSSFVYVNGSQVAGLTGTSANNPQWYDVTGVTNLTSIGIGNNGTTWSSLSQIEVDGQILTDATVGRNSFQLDFSDSSSNAALGFDSSGLGNDWTTNNLNNGASTPIYTSGLSYVGFSGTTTFGGDGPGGVGAFDGSATTRLTGDTSSGNGQTAIYTWVPPGGSISASSFKLKFQYFGTNSFGTTSVSVNGGNYYTQSGSTSITTYDFSSLITGGQITEVKVKWESNQSGIGAHAWYAMYINDVLLVDADPDGIDSLVDSPVNGNQTDAAGLGGIVQGNYAVLNPLNKHTSNNTLSNGNLEFTTSGSDGGLQESTIAMSSGKFYFEVVYSRSDQGQLAGIRKPGRRNYDDSYIYVGTGNKYTDGGSGASYGTGLVNGDVIGTAFDADNGTLTFYKNGVSQGQAFSGISGTYSFFVGSFGGAPTGVVNFGQRAFKHPLAGYKSLCTSNLPEPSILFPSQYFDTNLWSGNSGDGLAPTQDITTSFAPSFVWVKSRTDINGHSLFDIVRGIGKRLHTNTTGNETTKTQTLSNFLTNGFRINGDNSVNDIGQNYVSWSWAGGDATTTIAAGSLNSSMYDQSQTWSNSLTSDIGFAAAATNAFDGNTSTSGSSNTGGTLTFAPNLTIPANSTIEGWFGYSSTDSGATMKVTVNGVVNNSVPGDSWRTLNYNGSTTLSSFTVFRDGSTNSAEIRAIRINGKILVDSGVSAPNVPSIASTVRSSPESGFSIVTWTAAANATVAHQLNKAPELVLTKSRQHATAWRIWSPFSSSPDDRYLGFDTDGEGTYNGYWGSMTSSVITMPSVLDNNYGDMVAYCFTSVEGFSSFGSFQNPSSSQGAFVHLGFEPALLMIKCIINISSSSSSGDWIIKDATRSPVNNPSDGNTLVANVNNAEDNYYGAGQAAIDFLSNGFKIRHPNSSPAGDTGRLYIYAAWAKSPFKTARAR